MTRAGAILCASAAATIQMTDSAFVNIEDMDDLHGGGHRDGAASPYYLLKPSSFAEVLGEDLPWAQENIPLFESANSTLDLVYYFRWRTYKSHIHPTNCSAVGGFPPTKDCKNRSDGIDFVVTEFSPNVPWAGEYNTINCAAGHHMLEGGWMRSPIYMDSYTRWWVNNEARHNYYYWFATALRRNFFLTGNTDLLREVVPAYKAQFAQYATGALPSNHGNSEFSSEHDCLWNAPGKDPWLLTFILTLLILILPLLLDPKAMKGRSSPSQARAAELLFSRLCTARPLRFLSFVQPSETKQARLRWRPRPRGGSAVY